MQERRPSAQSTLRLRRGVSVVVVDDFQIAEAAESPSESVRSQLVDVEESGDEQEKEAAAALAVLAAKGTI